MFLPLSTLLWLINSKISRTYTYTMKLSKQQLKTSTRHYIKKCAGAVCTSKLHESARNSTYWIFLGQKKRLIFHPLSTLISPSGWLPKAITAPWKCSLRVQWWNTFQLGPKKPPKPLLAKNKFQPQTPKSHSQPSVHWSFKPWLTFTLYFGLRA